MKKPESLHRVPLRIYMMNLKGKFAANTTIAKVIVKDKRANITRLVKRGGRGAKAFEAALFIPPQKSAYPAWLPFLESGYGKKIRTHFAESAANTSLLVLKVGARFYAVPYGYGRTLINDDLVVRGFGIRTALGIADPRRLASIDSKTVDHNTFHTKLHSQQSVPIHEFSFDREQDILKGVHGFPSDANDLCSVVIGGDSLFVNPRSTFHGLGSMLAQCRAVYEAKKYLAKYDWLDNVIAVTSKRLIACLDAELVKKIRKVDPAVRLAAPEPVSPEGTAGFRFSRGDKAIRSEPNLADYVVQFRSPDGIVLKQLKNDKIGLVSQNTKADVRSWQVYKWLAFEASLEGQEYVLQDGSYYEVHADFRDKVNNSVVQIPHSKKHFPIWEQAVHPTEEEYNKYLQRTWRGSILLDKKCATDFEGHSKIEPCDVMLAKTSSPVVMVHVKKYDGGSAPLSHLFSQGAISAQALIEDERFRNEVRKMLPSRNQAALPTDISPENVDVVFAIALKDPPKTGAVKRLPFFSKLNLRQRAKTLRRLGFNVKLAFIEYRPDPAVIAEKKARKKAKVAKKKSAEE